MFLRVKFYKGPYHGKVRETNVANFGDPIMVAVTNKINYTDPQALMAALPIRTAIYKPKMMTLTDGGMQYRAPAMHPDGSIFYVFERWS